MTETLKPYAAATTDYLGCEYLGCDIENIEKIAAAGSQGPTEVVYLYAGSPPPEWQPIGTAPRNLPILTYRKAGLMAVAEWLDDDWCCTDGQYLRDVSHWMPIPTAPAKLEDKS